MSSVPAGSVQQALIIALPASTPSADDLHQHGALLIRRGKVIGTDTRLSDEPAVATAIASLFHNLQKLDKRTLSWDLFISICQVLHDLALDLQTNEQSNTRLKALHLLALQSCLLLGHVARAEKGKLGKAVSKLLPTLENLRLLGVAVRKRLPRADLHRALWNVHVALLTVIARDPSMKRAREAAVELLTQMDAMLQPPSIVLLWSSPFLGLLTEAINRVCELPNYSEFDAASRLQRWLTELSHHCDAVFYSRIEPQRSAPKEGARSADVAALLRRASAVAAPLALSKCLRESLAKVKENNLALQSAVRNVATEGFELESPSPTSIALASVFHDSSEALLSTKLVALLQKTVDQESVSRSQTTTTIFPLVVAFEAGLDLANVLEASATVFLVNFAIDHMCSWHLLTVSSPAGRRPDLALVHPSLLDALALRAQSCALPLAQLVASSPQATSVFIQRFVETSRYAFKEAAEANGDNARLRHAKFYAAAVAALLPSLPRANVVSLEQCLCLLQGLADARGAMCLVKKEKAADLALQIIFDKMATLIVLQVDSAATDSAPGMLKAKWKEATGAIRLLLPETGSGLLVEPQNLPSSARLLTFIQILHHVEWPADQLVLAVPFCLQILQFSRKENEALVAASLSFLQSVFVTRSPVAIPLWPVIMRTVLTQPPPLLLLQQLATGSFGKFVSAIEEFSRSGVAPPEGDAEISQLRSSYFLSVQAAAEVPQISIVDAVPKDGFIDAWVSIQHVNAGVGDVEEALRFLRLTAHSIHERCVAGIQAALQGRITDETTGKGLNALIATSMQFICLTEPKLLEEVLRNNEELFRLMAARPGVLAHWVTVFQGFVFKLTDYSTRRSVLTWFLDLRRSLLPTKSKL
eukprot:TRINITY_DN8034_c0_g1_i1.p1 TRINITY_DN8034_c0_g1~~TRINITY_DN8034_c0_g1_i1.p1  ORF type:complete len:880 (+),score=111.06 TRINITY_DN8034_c0_g1_i1:22-2640(+)